MALMNGDTSQPSQHDAQKDADKKPEPVANWAYKPAGDAAGTVPVAAPAVPVAPEETVQWTASEFVAHQKSLGWYLILAASALAAAGLIYLLTRGDLITALVVIVAAIFFGYVAGRKPRTLAYEINSGGITIGHRFYGYENFKSFWVEHQGAFGSVSFMPLKRFMPLLTIYYAAEQEDQILGVLGNHLPLEEAHRDMFDQFIDRIRF